MLLFATVVIPPSHRASAETVEDLVGTWVYKLGPNNLFALSLTRSGAKAGEVHGYLLRPEHFNLHTSGSVILFSQITNTSIREPVVSAGLHDGELWLVDESPKESSDPTSMRVRRLDSSHVALRLVPQLQPLRLERAGPGEPVLASDWDANRSYTEDDFAADNVEMKQIIDADQSVRQHTETIDWSVEGKRDEVRRQRTAVLLREGRLHTGNDFESAAFVFQHGGTPDDYLMAHTLAMVAMSKGKSTSIWIASATLDRYLQSIHQPQIYGTQFLTPGKEPTTQDPYNRALISDALRGQLGVPSQVEQDKQREHYDSQRGLKKP